MAVRSRLLVTLFLSLFLLIVAVKGNTGPAGKFRSRPRNQMKPIREAALPEEDLFFQLSSKEAEPSATPDEESEFNDLDWNPGKRGRDHGKKLSFSDFYVSRGKKLNPDMFYVSRGKREVVYGLGDGRPQFQGFSSGSRGSNGLEAMDREKWSGRGMGGGSGSMKNRLVGNIRNLERVKKDTQNWSPNPSGRHYHTLDSMSAEAEAAPQQYARTD